MQHQTTEFITTDHLEAAVSAATGQTKFKRALLNIIASFFFILRPNTLLVTVSGLVAYWVYDHEEWGLGVPLNIDLSIVSFGVFFPLGFVIGAVYRRRDDAALVIGALKAAALGLVMMARDWDQTYVDGIVGANSAKPHPVALTADRSEGRGLGGTLFAEMRAVCAHFMDLVRAFLYHKNDETRKPIEREVYKTIHTLSVLSEQLRVQAGYAKGGEGGMSRSAQFVTYLIRHFEELRTWREYRSPYGLRYTIAMCTHVLPAVLAPMWRNYAVRKPDGSHQDQDDVLADADGSITAYVSVTLFSLILMTLFNVYRDLEDPFDGDGWDDLKSDWPLEWLSGAEMTPHSRDELDAIMQAKNGFRHAKTKSKPMMSTTEHRRVAPAPPIIGVRGPDVPVHKTVESRGSAVRPLPPLIRVVAPAPEV